MLYLSGRTAILHYGAIAQLGRVSRWHREGVGSNPTGSTRIHNDMTKTITRAEYDSLPKCPPAEERIKGQRVRITCIEQEDKIGDTVFIAVVKTDGGFVEAMSVKLI